MDDNNFYTLRKNPSREACENAIRRILMTEILQNGKNEHFKTSSDFMPYFESLYPTSNALVKQVQRALKSLNMPKDEHGYFIPNKTEEQLEQEKELRYLFRRAEAEFVSLEGCVPLFLKTAPEVSAHLMCRIGQSDVFRDKYVMMQEVFNGILFYTKTPTQLQVLLESLIVR